MRVCVQVFMCSETIFQSRRVTLGSVPRRQASTLAPVYLWTKGCPKTNDLAPVSQRGGVRDEKRWRSASQEAGEKKMIKVFQRICVEHSKGKEGRSKGHKKLKWGKNKNSDKKLD